MTLALILIVAMDLFVLALLGMTLRLPFQLRHAPSAQRAARAKPARRTHRFTPEGAKQAPGYRDPATVDA